MGNVKIGSHPPPLLDGHDDEQLNGYEHDEGLLIGTDCKEYQDTNKHCIYLRGKAIKKSQILDFNNYRHPIINDHLKMAQKEDRSINWQQRNEEELYLLNEEENSYTGMSRQELRKARGAIEKLIYIIAIFIAKAIVIYQDILLICSSFPPSLVFPEPANQQSKTISSVIKFILFETCALKKEEEMRILFVYWYSFIMSVKQYMEDWKDSKLFEKYIRIFGYYATRLMRYTLDQIYENHRINNTESFEVFIKRILGTQKNFKDNFSKDEIPKITLYDRFDITLLDKCINICAGYYSLDKIYETNKQNNSESFEGFLKRVILGSGLIFEKEFSEPERMKIKLYKNFNANLTNKCINICINKCKPIILLDIVQDYLSIQGISRKIKDRRNDNFHNLPEPGIIVCKEFNNTNLNELEFLLNDLVKFTKKQFPFSCTEKITKYMKLKFFLSKIPASFSDICCIIVVPIFLYKCFFY